MRGKAKAIMIQGTASGVGKTILTMALCGIFRQDGYKVAPFKSQNMTANTVLTDEGEEIAVSQALQACAAGIRPSAEMNPVVLKPSPGKQGSAVILHGRPYATLDASGYREAKAGILVEMCKAYDALAQRHDIIVIEGAGSPVELNLNKGDVVNMGIAMAVGAAVLLVADIDRGGVFAALHGTLSLLGEAERKYVKGLVINRFRGDLALFAEGRAMLEEITGLPVVGIVPFFPTNLPEEDSFSAAGAASGMAGTAGTLEAAGAASGTAGAAGTLEAAGAAAGMAGALEGAGAASGAAHLPLVPSWRSLQSSSIDKQMAGISACVREALDLGLLYQILEDGVSDWHRV